MVTKYDPDILALTETRVSGHHVKDLVFPSQYHVFSECCTPPHQSYGGVIVLSKYQPSSIRHGLGRLTTDAEGRALTLEFSTFFLVSIYAPNAGIDLN